MPESEKLGRTGAPAPREDGATLSRRKRRRAARKARVAAMSRRRRLGRRVGIGATAVLAFLAVVMLAAVVLFYSLSNVPSPASLPLPQTATVLYSNGHVMAQIGSVNRRLITLDQVPEQVRWDVLAAEDRGFYSEPGISIRGTLRAALNDLTGGDTQGGSGITQQYVKNAYLSNSRTLTRKLKELAIAIKLSREYSKDQILQDYLNTVYFGRGTYGIESASLAYFGEPVSKLDTAQGAVLAALLQAPSYYDPALNPGPARQRWRYVLDGMVSTGHLTQAQENRMRYPTVLPVSKDNGLGASGPAALIVQRVIGELQAHGISEDEIYARGLTIRTTISQRAQHDAELAVRQTFAHLTRQQRTMKNALVAVDPRTGGVLAYYGGPDGKDYAGKDDYYDYAGLGFAAPGSSFKPYTLATALTQTLRHTSPGTPITIDSIVDGSQCVTIEATRICNDPSDAVYASSAVSVANAMKFSLNTTFDQMAAAVGPAHVATLAHAAGISATINGRPSLTNAQGRTTFGIGIGDFPVHPLDQAVGFATFADHGMANSSYLVQSATASDGQTVYTHKAAPTRAMSPKVANDVTLTLEPIAGFSGDALAGGRVSAAKTGTEGIQQGRNLNKNSDAWMVGYTPQVSAAVWVGSGNSTRAIYDSYGSNEYGRDLPGRTWKLFMDTYLANAPMLPMATHQEVFATAADARAAATPSSSPVTSSSSAAPTAGPTTAPTFTLTTGFPSPTPTTARPTPTPTPTTSTRVTPTPTPTASCASGLLGPTCTSPTTVASSTPPATATSSP